MLYGRTDELNKLNDYYNGVGNSFIMLYGRSNIGKTALLREFIKDKKAFYYNAALASEKEQAELAAAKAQSAERKKTLLDNNDPNFVNPKEKLYDKFPLTVHQMDIIIGVLFALILLFLVLGMTHTSFFGLFGG